MTFYRGEIRNPSPTRTILSGNTATTVLAAADQTQSIAKIRICNVDSGAITATVDVYDGSTAHKLTNATSIAAGAALEIYDELLEQGESLRVTSSSSSGLLHVHVLHALVNIPGA
jgi:hypothetical protein